MRVRMIVMTPTGDVMWAEDSSYENLDRDSMFHALDCGWWVQVAPLMDDESPLPAGGAGYPGLKEFIKEGKGPAPDPVQAKMLKVVERYGVH